MKILHTISSKTLLLFDFSAHQHFGFLFVDIPSFERSLFCLSPSLTSCTPIRTHRMSLDRGTRTFADIDIPVDPTVPSEGFYCRNKMVLQYHAPCNATRSPSSECELQELIKQVYLQILPPRQLPSPNRPIRHIAKAEYLFHFPKFDLGHLRTRDPESGNLSTFFNTPMHLAVIERMSGGENLTTHQVPLASVSRMASL